MRFLRPTSPSSSSVEPKQVATFGQARAEALSERLDTALKDRRKLAAAEYVSPAEIRPAIEARAQMISQRIDHLTEEQKNLRADDGDQRSPQYDPDPNN